MMRLPEVLEELSEGEVRTGTVTNLAKFGAFVDVNLLGVWRGAKE